MADNRELWAPDAARIEHATLTHYIAWLRDELDRGFDDYEALWRWSVDEPEAFWLSVQRYFDVPISAADDILGGGPMPEQRWFAGATVNYVDQVHRHCDSDAPAIIAEAEDGTVRTLSWRELRAQSAALAATLRAAGIKRGDRVVAYLPNIPETIVAFHAVASIGAVWSVCAPDLGVQGVLDRFAQIAPRALIACDGYRYGGKLFARGAEVAALCAGLPDVRLVINVGCEGCATPELDGVAVIDWQQALTATAPEHVAAVDFSHPLWIVYSSGTTGKPKAIVHSHGGILLEHVKQMRLQLDLQAGQRFMWFSSTAWMMWNYNIAGLLVGATVVIYDGNPGRPDLYRLWQLVDRHDVHYFGAGAAFFEACSNAGLVPGEQLALAALQSMGSTGSPLLPAMYDWIYAAVKSDIFLSSISGGTDFASACVGGAPTVPVYRGEISCRSLGCAVYAFDQDARPVIDEVGELVITKPMPSMPIYFWDDADKSKYRSSYFETFPGVWQHGDWIRITARGSAVIYGRSDATINRQGIRMGTSELYRVVEALPAVADSLVVDLEFMGRKSYLPLFIVLADGAELDDALRHAINDGIRRELSPRHVPDDIFVIDDVPRTFSGKKMEIPVRRVLLGQTPAAAINRETMANPDSIDYFVALAERGVGIAPD